MKIVFKVLTALVALLLLAGLAAGILFKARQNTISAKITGIIHQYVGGVVETGTIGVDFFATFPYPAVEIRDFIVKDSLVSVHQKPFFKADKVFVSVDLFSILTGKSSVRGLEIVDGEFNVFTAENGAGNDYLFKGRPVAAGQKGEMLKNITLKNVLFNSVNKEKDKIYSIELQKIHAKVKQRKNLYELDAYCNVFIRKASFQDRESPILSGQRLTADFQMVYNRAAQRLQTDSMQIELNGRELNIGLSIDLSGPAPVVSSKINSGKFLLF